MHNKRFYVKTCILKLASEKQVALTLTSQEALVNQLKNVFRLRSGDRVIFFDNTGYDFLVNIDAFGKAKEKDSINFTILETNKNTVALGRDVYLFASIIKKDNFEWVAQKATELGVTHIVPILSERSEKKDLNFERLNKIVIEASEQSGRGVIPIVSEIVTLEDAISNYHKVSSIALHTIVSNPVSQDLSKFDGVYIGPEGGWSEKEIELFKQNKIAVYSLGPQVLRAETAVVAALSLLVFK